MNHVRFECPSCSQPIETDEATARKGVRCPGCGVGFVPEGFRHDPRRPDPPSPENELQRRREKIQNQAQAFTGIACIVFVIGILALGAGVSQSIGIDAQGGGVFWIIMSACFGLAFWLYLVGQIIHIRANTEK